MQATLTTLAGSRSRFVHGEPHQPLRVVASPALLRIVVGKIVRNAVEHAGEGEIRVAIDGACLHIEGQRPGFDAAEAAGRGSACSSCAASANATAGRSRSMPRQRRAHAWR